jgi:hypothetical protein
LNCNVIHAIAEYKNAKEINNVWFMSSISRCSGCWPFWSLTTKMKAYNHFFEEAPKGKTLLPPLTCQWSAAQTYSYHWLWTTAAGVEHECSWHSKSFIWQSLVMYSLLSISKSTKWFVWTVNGIHYWVHTWDQVIAALIPYVRTQVLTVERSKCLRMSHFILTHVQSILHFGLPSAAHILLCLEIWSCKS